MKRTCIATVFGLALISACTSRSGVANPGAAASPIVPTPSTPVATRPVQTAIPDGTYRTRARTVQDLIALGLTKNQIATDKVNEQFVKTIVYEIRILGDELVLTAATDGGTPYVVDHEILTARGDTVILSAPPGDPPCKYVMRSSLASGVLKLKLLKNTCTDPKCCTDALVRSAYEALPFKAVN